MYAPLSFIQQKLLRAYFVPGFSFWLVGIQWLRTKDEQDWHGVWTHLPDWKRQEASNYSDRKEHNYNFVLCAEKYSAPLEFVI